MDTKTDFPYDYECGSSTFKTELIIIIIVDVRWISRPNHRKENTHYVSLIFLIVIK